METDGALFYNGLNQTMEDIMRSFKIILSCVLVVMLLIGCGSSAAKKWVSSEMANLADPGFTITDKQVSGSEVRYTFANLSDQKISDFLSALYESEFVTQQNYYASTTYVSYAATNTAGESLHFIYNVTDKTGVLIYGIALDKRFMPGLRDMGYGIQSHYEYESNSDYTKYNATLWYSVYLYVDRTDYTEIMTSCVMHDFKIKTASRSGTLSFGLDPWSATTANFTHACDNLGDLNVVVRQRNIGSYATNLDNSSDKSAYFSAMGLSQSDLAFTITFTVDITTDKASYTKDYELTIMPTGSDTTKMPGGTLTVEKQVADPSLGTPYTKN